MPLDNLKVWCSPLTSNIYAGYLNSQGKAVRAKVEVTQQVINAVMQHLDQTRNEYESQAGEIVFKPKAIESNEYAQPKVEAEPLPFEPSSKELEAME